MLYYYMLLPLLRLLSLHDYIVLHVIMFRLFVLTTAAPIGREENINVII